MGIPLWLVSLVIGVLIALIVVSTMKGQLKTVRHQDGAGSYIRPGSLCLTIHQDIFLYQHTTKQPKPKSNR